MAEAVAKTTVKQQTEPCVEKWEPGQKLPNVIDIEAIGKILAESNVYAEQGYSISCPQVSAVSVRLDSIATDDFKLEPGAVKVVMLNRIGMGPADLRDTATKLKAVTGADTVVVRAVDGAASVSGSVPRFALEKKISSIMVAASNPETTTVAYVSDAARADNHIELVNGVIGVVLTLSVIVSYICGRRLSE